MRLLRNTLAGSAAAAAIALVLASGALGASQRAAGSPAVTSAATSVTSTTAVLNGNSTVCGSGGSSSYQYGLTSGYGTTVAANSPSLAGNQPILITGLTPATTYHFRFTATICTGPGPDLTFTTLSASTPAVAPKDESADMAITKSQSSDTVSAGDQVTYTLTVTHRVGARAFNVIAVDVLPVGLSAVSVTTTQGTCTKEVRCSLGEMGQGDSVTVKIVVTANVAGVIVNSAAVGATNPDPNIGGNNTSRTVLSVQPKPVARTLAVTTVERSEGPGFNDRDSVIRLAGTLSSDDTRCVGSIGLGVYVGASEAAVTAATSASLTITTAANGSFDAKLTDLVGPYWQVRAADFTDPAAGAFRCAAAAAPTFSIGPRIVGRTLAATVERVNGDPTRIRITGTVSADSLWCSAQASVAVAVAGVKAARSDGKGAFSVTLAPGTLPSVSLSLASALAGDNECGKAALTLDVPPQPVTRTITPAKVVRPTAGVGTASDTETWTLAAVVAATEQKCVTGARMVLQHRDGPTYPWESVTVSKAAGADGKVSLRVPFDDGQFRVALDREIVGNLACVFDDASVQVPSLEVKRSLTAGAVRVPGAPRFIQLTGTVEKGVSGCQPDVVLVERRTGATWDFVGQVPVLGTDGSFGGQISPGESRQVRVSLGEEQRSAKRRCLDAAVTVDVPTEPDARTIRLTSKATSRQVTPLEVEVTATVLADGAPCAQGRQVTIRGGLDPRSGTTGAASFGQFGPFNGASVTVTAAAGSSSPGESAIWNASVEREPIAGADCLAYAFDQRGLAAVKAVNQAGVYSLTGTLRAVTAPCKGGTSVAIQAFRAPANGTSGAVTWRDVVTGVTNPDGSFSLGFSDPAAVKAADGWRITADAVSSRGFGCSAVTTALTLPDPEPTPPPPPPAPVVRNITNTLEISGLTAKVTVHVTAVPASGADSCVRGQRVYFHLYGAAEAISNLDLGADGTASVTFPLQKRAQAFTVDLSAAGPVGRCAAFRTLYDSIPGYGEPSEIARSIAGPGGAGTALEAGNTTNVGAEIRGRVLGSSAVCTSGAYVELIGGPRTLIAAAATTEQDGSFTLRTNWDPAAAGRTYTVSVRSQEYPLMLCKGATADVKLPAAGPDPDPNRGFTTTKLTASYTPDTGPIVKETGGTALLSGRINVTLDVTGGERKADCKGVAATATVVGRGQSGFIGSDGKGAILIDLRNDESDATVTVSYGPYTAAFCRPPAPVTVRIPALDDGIINAEAGEYRSASAAAAKINEVCGKDSGWPERKGTRAGTVEVWKIHCATTALDRFKLQSDEKLQGPVDKMTGWILK